MDMGTGPTLIWGTIMVVLLLSSLAARRLPLNQTLRFICTWIAIFAVVYTLFLFRLDLAVVWNRAVADLTGGSEPSVAGTQTILQRIDGHFYATATINGQPIEFLVDSGATVTTLGPEAARSVHIAPSAAAFPIVVQTANGLANSWPVEDQTISLGSITLSGLEVHVSDREDGANLLGMNSLNRLSSWQVRGDQMILNP